LDLQTESDSLHAGVRSRAKAPIAALAPLPRGNFCYDARTMPEKRLSELEPAERNAACGAQVRDARDALRMGDQRGEKPDQLMTELAGAFDGLILGLCDGLLGPMAQLCLVALGGYGRGRFYPYSDLDLLLLHREGEGDLAEEVAERLVYPLWDAKVAVSFSSRTVGQMLELAASDLRVQTTLLDARLIMGNQGLFLELQAGGHNEFFAPERVNQLLDVLREERASRHARYGDTVYLLEPNVKYGKGGMRDLNAALWAAKARYGIRDLSQLTAVGAATDRQERILAEAHDFMRRLRFSMHLVANRAQDQLLFELQEKLAPVLFPPEQLPVPKRACETVAVEQLMHAYYVHARAVAIETEGIWDRCRIADQGHRPSERKLGGNFLARDGELFCIASEGFWERPVDLVRAFELALEHGLKLSRLTRDLIAEAVAGAPGKQLVADHEAASCWLRILGHSEEPGRPSILLEMHELGLITALIPEFEACTGRAQHDIYHVYTVDRHSLYLVDLVKALRRGEKNDVYTHAAHVIVDLKSFENLVLACLLHDVAKPLGRGHAEKGARLAAGVTARLGLDSAAQSLITFLVREHLAMAHVSQRRDLSDPRQIAAFAEKVGTVETLRYLYLLTLADTAMTAPGNLTGWKASLLEELYLKVEHSLSGEDPTERELARQKKSKRDILTESLGKCEFAQNLVGRLPDDLLAGAEIDDLVHYGRTALRLEAGDRSVEVATRGADGNLRELTICNSQRSELLATISGVMLLHRIDVLAGQVYNLRAPSQGQASVSRCDSLSVFWVEVPLGVSAEERWSAFVEDLAQGMDGRLSVREEVSRRRRPSGLPPRVMPTVNIEVSIDNHSSERATIVQVQAPDCIGLLHEIAQALADFGLVIDVAKVSTEAGRIIDSFYVRSQEDQQKVTSMSRLEQIRLQLTRVMRELERSGKVE
jgi:[protein-PII] uridylyltransferase